MNPNPETSVPETIRILYSDPTPDWLSYLSKLDRWSPFTAASILLGLRPGEYDIKTKTIEAFIEVDPDDENAFGNYDGDSESLVNDLRHMTEVIAANAANENLNYVTPSEIVVWAVKNNTLPRDCEIALKLDLTRFHGQFELLH